MRKNYKFIIFFLFLFYFCYLLLQNKIRNDYYIFDQLNEYVVSNNIDANTLKTNYNFFYFKNRINKFYKYKHLKDDLVSTCYNLEKTYNVILVYRLNQDGENLFIHDLNLFSNCNIHYKHTGKFKLIYIK